LSPGFASERWQRISPAGAAKTAALTPTLNSFKGFAPGCDRMEYEKLMRNRLVVVELVPGLGLKGPLES
jgi:hypothetical protein